MKQPEFRIIKVSGRTRDFYYLEERGWLWGWNKVPSIVYYDGCEYVFETIEDCEKEITAILRERIPDEVIKEIYTNKENNER